MTSNQYRFNLSRIQGLQRTLLFATAILLVVSGCELPFEKELEVQNFIIREGDHYSTPRLMETVESGKVKFKATFDESAMYVLEDPSMQQNKNKLMGFSDCNSLHHENSARFAWQWYNDQLEIFAYCYVDSTRTEQFIGTVELNEENLYEITTSGDEYIFWLNGEKTVAMPRKNACEEGVRYKLYPYFGGSVPAPHDVRIKIEMVE